MKTRVVYCEENTNNKRTVQKADVAIEPQVSRQNTTLYSESFINSRYKQVANKGVQGEEIKKKIHLKNLD